MNIETHILKYRLDKNDYINITIVLRKKEVGLRTYENYETIINLKQIVELSMI